MKKHFILLIIVLLLTSCDYNEDYELPYNELGYEIEIHSITPDYRNLFDTDHTLSIDDSNVDLATLGEYILYVEDDGKEYQVPITVVDTIAPIIHIPDNFVTTYDYGDILDLSEVTVSDNSLEEISVSTNIHEINTNTNGTYTLQLTAIDSSSNKSTTEIEIMVQHDFNPSINIKVFNVTVDSFEVQFEDVDLSTIKLYGFYSITNNGELISDGDITDSSPITISNLKNNTTYQVSYHCYYEIPGGSMIELVESVEVQTLQVLSPMVYLLNEETSMDTVSFDILKIDPNTMLEYITVDVIDMFNTVVYSTNVDALESIDISNLSFGQEYNIELEYAYPSSEQAGLNVSTITYTVRMDEKSLPLISMNSILVEDNRILINTSVVDSDSSLNNLTLKVYRGDEVIATENIEHNQNVATIVEDLLYSTEYTMKLEAEYETILGQTVVVDIYDNQLSIPSMNVLSIDAEYSVVEPDSLATIVISLDNPYNLAIDSFTMNGSIYTESEFSYVEGLYYIDVPTISTVGTYTVDLSSISIEGIENTYTSEFATLHLKSRLRVLSMSPANNPTTWYTEPQMTIVLENPTQQEILSVKINSITYTQEQFTIDASQEIITVSVPHCIGFCNQEYVLNEILINFNGYEEYLGLYETITTTVHFSDQSVIEISDAQDLEDICLSPNLNYKLVNDIDLTGINWDQSCDFYGYLNGSGYAINGLHIVTLSENVGLFSTITSTGYIVDLNISNATIDVNEDISAFNSTNIGILTGTFNGYIENVNIDGVINMVGDASSYGNYNIGGVTGSSMGGRMYQVQTDVSFDMYDSQIVYVGGISGESIDSEYTSVLTYGSIQFDEMGTVRSGGISGLCSGCEMYAVGSEMDIYDIGTTTYVYLGGLIGYCSYSGLIGPTTIEQFYFKGNIVSTSTGLQKYMGGIIGYDAYSILSNGYIQGTLEVTLNAPNLNIGGVSSFFYESTVNQVLMQLEIIIDVELPTAVINIGLATSSGNMILNDVYMTEFHSYQINGTLNVPETVYTSQISVLQSDNIDEEFYEDTLGLNIDFWNLIGTTALSPPELN